MKTYDDRNDIMIVPETDDYTSGYHPKYGRVVDRKIRNGTATTTYESGIIVYEDWPPPEPEPEPPPLAFDLAGRGIGVSPDANMPGTTSHDEIRAMWKEHPGAEPLVVLGRGLVAVTGDVDGLPDTVSVGDYARIYRADFDGYGDLWGGTAITGHGYGAGADVGPGTVADLPDDVLAVAKRSRDAAVFGRKRLDLSTAAPPEMLWEPLIYKVGVTTFAGPAGHGKTWAALKIVADLISGGFVVVYLDHDANGHAIDERLFSLGATRKDVDTNLIYIPDPRISPEEYRRLLDNLKPDLVIIDNVTRALTVAGVSAKDPNGVDGWLSDYAAPVMGRGSAALLLDHTPASDPNGDPRDSRVKVQDVTAIWNVRQTKEFNRDSVGTLRFARRKDNFGVLPKKVLYKVGGTPFHFKAMGQVKLTNQRGALLDVLVDGMTSPEWLRAAKDHGVIQYNANFYRDVNALVEGGYVDQTEDDRYYREV